MLLDSNTKKVLDLIQKFDNLSNIGKIRLALYLTENKNFNTTFNTRGIIEVLDNNYTKIITNFSKYNHLLFLSAKHSELSEIKKKKFSIEMLFNIYDSDFGDDDINTAINQNLLIFDYSCSLLN